MVLIRKEIGYKGEKVNEKSILQILIAKKEECENLCKQLGYKDSFLYSIRNKIFYHSDFLDIFSRKGWHRRGFGFEYVFLNL